MGKPIKYKNSCCKYYDELNGYFCRVCGSSVQYLHKSRQRISHVFSTNEKYCDQCGGKRHSGVSCSPVKKLIQ